MQPLFMRQPKVMACDGNSSLDIVDVCVSAYTATCLSKELTWAAHRHDQQQGGCTAAEAL